MPTYRVRNLLAGLLLAALTLTAGGCNILGVFASALGENRKAVYPLQDRPTLVLVDDPASVLGDPNISGLIEAQIVANISSQKVVTNFSDLKKINELKARLGERWPQTPMDEVGKLTGAEQVIYIYVASAGYDAQPGIFRPAAVVQVKVIDVPTGKRLFPPASAADNVTNIPDANRGYTLQIVMRYKPADPNAPNLITVMRQKLAERIGREVSQVFYDHMAPGPGEMDED